MKIQRPHACLSIPHSEGYIIQGPHEHVWIPPQSGRHTHPATPCVEIHPSQTGVRSQHPRKHACASTQSPSACMHGYCSMYMYVRVHSYTQSTILQCGCIRTGHHASAFTCMYVHTHTVHHTSAFTCMYVHTHSPPRFSIHMYVRTYTHTQSSINMQEWPPKLQSQPTTTAEKRAHNTQDTHTTSTGGAKIGHTRTGIHTAHTHTHTHHNKRSVSCGGDLLLHGRTPHTLSIWTSRRVPYIPIVSIHIYIYIRIYKHIHR